MKGRGANRRRKLQEEDEALGRSSTWSTALRRCIGVRESKAQVATRGARNDTVEKLKSFAIRHPLQE